MHVRPWSGSVLRIATRQSCDAWCDAYNDGFWRDFFTYIGTSIVSMSPMEHRRTSGVTTNDYLAQSCLWSTDITHTMEQDSSDASYWRHSWELWLPQLTAETERITDKGFGGLQAINKKANYIEGLNWRAQHTFSQRVFDGVKLDYQVTNQKKKKRGSFNRLNQRNKSWRQDTTRHGILPAWGGVSWHKTSVRATTH